MKKLISLVLCLLLIVSLGACGSKSKIPPIVIYEGQLAEMQIIHQMVKLLVEQDTDIPVEIRDQMTAVNSFKELVKGSCDLMNSYDGTVLTTFLKLDPSDVPPGQSLYDFANAAVLEKHQVRLLNQLGIDNTYALAVPQPIADKYHLNTISDLVPVAGELVFGAEHDFFSQEGSMKYNPFVAFYGLKFKDGKPVDLGLKYAAVESGNLDVTVVYTTDGLNKKAKLKVLEDDRGYFPDYNGALLVRDDLFERYKDTAPDLEAILNKLGGCLTNDDMVNLTYAVDVEGKTVPEVTKAYMKEKGLLK